MNKERRKYARFPQQKSLVVELYLNVPELTEISKILGLMVNESLGGCKIVVVSDLTLEVNGHYLLKFPELKLKPIPAKIAWIQPLETTVFMLGLDYLVEHE